MYFLSLMSDKKCEPTEKGGQPFGTSPKICNFAFEQSKIIFMDKFSNFPGQPVLCPPRVWWYGRAKSRRFYNKVT